MNNIQFTKKIKSLCEQSGIPIAKLLTDCSLPKSFIYDVEKRSTAPSIEKLEKIADYFKVSVDFLLGNSNTPNELAETASAENDVVIYCRNGETVKKKFTEEQMEYLEKFIRSISDEDYPDF